MKLANPKYVRLALVAAALASFALIHPACGVSEGGEGDRCNPNLSHNECDDALTCIQPGACPENYCCPANPATSKNAFCRGDQSVCPSDSGTGNDGGDAASDATSDAPEEDSPADSPADSADGGDASDAPSD